MSQQTKYGPKWIDWQTVTDIRKLYLSGSCKQKELAILYNVSQSLISKIVNNQVHRKNTNLLVGGEAGVRLGFKYGNQR